MFRKFLLFSCLLWGNFLLADQAKLELSFYKETEHFQAYCLEQDFTATEELLQDLEQYWIKWTQDLFNSPFHEKIKLNIFPDTQSYHCQIIGDSAAPDWKVCMFNYENNSISIVSPSNPGTVHSKDSIIKCGRLCLGWFFVYQKYDLFPFWLAAGLSYYEAQIYSQELVYKYILNDNNEIDIPSLAKLEARGQPLERKDLIACYVFAKFLIDNWGMDKAFAVLDDYSSFETILGVSKEEFRIKCAQYLQLAKVEK